MVNKDKFNKKDYTDALSKRLKEIAYLKQTSLRQICIKLELSNSHFADSRNFGILSMAKLYDLYKDINLPWLLLGVGAPFGNEENDSTTFSSYENTENDEMVEDFFKIIRHKDEQIKNGLDDKEFALKILEKKVSSLKLTIKKLQHDLDEKG